MQIHLHQTHHKVGDFTGIFRYLEENFQKKTPQSGLHVFPELFLTGYPLQDLCLQKSFIDNYLESLEQINKWAQCLSNIGGDCVLLIGGLNYTFDSNALPLEIKNTIYKLEFGKAIEPLYHKILLPNYDIFDEKKYFSPGKDVCIWEWKSKNIALMICEDMWPSSKHPLNPTQMLAEKEVPLDLVVNLSASPFYLGKENARIERAQEISNFLNCPFAYVNRVGGEDEILFDGASFILNGKEVLAQGENFKQQVISLDIPEASRKLHNPPTGKIVNTWENLFRPSYQQEVIPPKIKPLSDQDCELIIKAICFGIQEYTRKTGFSKFTIGLSGGIDSTLVLALCKISLQKNQSVEAIFLPGLFSSSLSYELAHETCQKMGVKLNTLPIKFFHSSIRNAYKDTFSNELKGLADENIQSRLRGALLFARANSENSLVLNTSNKSELAVGYSTLYGDSVGAISPLGDLYKSEVFQLSKFINKKYGEVIPERVITREPSAELRADQVDSQSLPPYDRLDAILEGFLSYRLSKKDLLKLNFSEEEIEKVYGLYMKSEYKRSQFCPIIKLKAKSFGFGYRVPICKQFN